MANGVDIWPYSGRNDGAVSDAEHEYLWASDADGLLPDQDSSAGRVSVTGAAWTVQPCHARVAGHVVRVDHTITKELTPNHGSGSRTDRIVLQIDRSQSPWERDVIAVEGSPGAGVPSLDFDRGGVWQFPLGAIDVDPSGATALRRDERTWLSASGTRCRSAARPANPRVGDVSYETDTGRTVLWDGSKWQVLFEDTGWITLTPAGYWRELAVLRGIRRNGWCCVRGGLERYNSRLDPGEGGSDGQSPLLARVPDALLPAYDTYDTAWIRGRGGITARLNLHNGNADGRMYLTGWDSPIYVGQNLFFTLTYPGA